MPRQVSKGDVRHAHTSLKRAMSEWKAMNRNGRGDGENEEEMEEAWTRLCEEIEDASAVVRGASAQGLNVKEVTDTLSQAREIVKGRKKGGEEVRPGTSSAVSPPTTNKKGEERQQSEGREEGDSRGKGKGKGKGRGKKNETMGATVGDGGSQRSSDSGKSQRERDLAKRTLEREEREAKLEEEMATVTRRMEELKARQQELRAKRVHLGKEQEFDERRSQLEREEEDAKSQSLSSSEEEEEEEETPMEALATMVKVRKKRKRGKEKDAAATGMAQNAKAARVDTAESAKMELATSTDATAANAAIDRIEGQMVGVTQRPSLLELVKLLERQRPQEKFDGVAKKIDFEDHMCRFERAVNTPGLPATWKLAEMNEWFAGLAKVQVSRFMRRVDAEKAFEEAVGKLKQEYGESTTGEEMLEALLEGPKLDALDAEEINIFVSSLEEIFSLAVETNRNGDFDREPLYKRILAAKLPFLKREWARHVEEKQMKRPKFMDFLTFLSLERKIARRWVALEETDEPGKTVGVTASANTAALALSTTAKVPGQTRLAEYQEDKNGRKGMEMRRDMVGVQEQGAAVGTQGGPRFGMKGRSPPPCGLCNDWHPLDICQRFQAMRVDERWSFVREKNRCPLCLKIGHGLDNCYSGARCFCSEQHHIWLHSWGVNGDGQSGEHGVTF